MTKPEQMIIESIACYIVCNQMNPETYTCLYQHGDRLIVNFVCNHNLRGLSVGLIVYKQNDASSNEVSVEKMPRFCEGIYNIDKKLKWSLTSVVIG